MKSVSIMLEKKANILLVEKLRTILLLEADYNTLNKIIFNTRIIPMMEERNDIPYIVGGRHS